jgi:hypothetical protein
MALTDAGVAAVRGCKTNNGGAQPREKQREECRRDRNRGGAGISVDEVEREKVEGGKSGERQTTYGIRWPPQDTRRTLDPEVGIKAASGCLQLFSISKAREP